MEDTMEEENGREAKLKAEITRWLIFFGVAIMLSVMTWLGWSLTNRKNPITSFTTLVSDSSVAIGIQGSAPESLDIRTEQGTTLEQALLENVYETLVSRSETTTAAVNREIMADFRRRTDLHVHAQQQRDLLQRTQARLVRRGLVAAKRHQQQLRGIRPTW